MRDDFRLATRFWAEELRLGQQALDFPPENGKLPFHDVPHHLLVHHVVGVDEDVPEIDDPSSVRDP